MSDVAIKKLDPNTIARSIWANRHEQSFNDKDFIKLKNEIDAQGGNVQPIKVRPVQNKAHDYEVIFGHRRHQACLVLGLPVLAMIADATDLELFNFMDRENRERKDLAPYERGVAYAKALDFGLFPSMRKLSDSLGIDVATVSRYVTLARLPDAIINAFASPLDIQFNWITKLNHAWQAKPEEVIRRAEVLLEATPKPPPRDIFLGLIEDPSVASRNTLIEIKGDQDRSGVIQVNRKKNSIDISLNGVSADKVKQIEHFVRDLIHQDTSET